MSDILQWAKDAWNNSIGIGPESPGGRIADALLGLGGGSTPAGSTPPADKAPRAVGTKAQKAAEGAAEVNQRIDNLNALASKAASKPWNTYSDQERAVAGDLAQSLFHTRDLANLTNGQWQQLGAVAGQNSQTLQNQQGTGESAAGIEKQITADPWSQLASGLVNIEQQASAPVEEAVSGALVGPSMSTALQTALSASGVAPNSATGQAVEGELATGAQIASPLMSALASYGAAYGAGQETVDSALTQLGQGEALNIDTAPEQAWLNTAASHLGYGSAYTVPPAIASTMPSWLQSALATAGFQGVSSSGPSATAASLAGVAPSANILGQSEAANPTGPSSGIGVTG